MIPGRKKVLIAIYEVYTKHGIPLLANNANSWSFIGSDDPGFFLYVSLFSSFLHVPILQGAQLFVFTVCALLFCSFMLLSIMESRLWTITIISFFYIFFFIFKLSSICDVYIASAGAFIPLPFLFVSLRGKSGWGLYVSSFLLGLIGGMCSLVRSYSLLPPLVLGVTIVVFCKVFSRKQKIIAFILLLISYSIVQVHYFRVLNLRNQFLFSQGIKPMSDSRHVFWHSIYSGLGFTRNNYNLRWQDGCAHAAIKKIDFRCGVGSKKGEAITKNLIFDLLKKDRHFVLTSLFARLGVVIMFFLIWFGWIGLLCSYFYPKPWYEELAFILALGASALPGILAIPCFEYLTGFVTCTVLYAVYSMAYASRYFLRWNFFPIGGSLVAICSKNGK